MTALQSIVQDVLLATGASRAMLQLAAPGGRWTFAAEAVTHGLRQIRNDDAAGDIPGPLAIQKLEREQQIVAQDDTERADPPAARALVDRFDVHAQILAPLIRDGRLVGLISVHNALGPRRWEHNDINVLRTAQVAALAVLESRDSVTLETTEEDLQDAAIQAILDALRHGLRVQRCTLRQDVSAAYAFPVTHESRGESVWSLRGDFTIVQSGQPVIEKMLAERVQVVQNDTRNASSDSMFHVMLKHYGDMRAQIVTPLFREERMAAVLSVHNLNEVRVWTSNEAALVRSAAGLLGLLVGATLA